MKCSDLERIVKWNRDYVDRRSVMLKPDMASFLANDPVAKVLQCADDTIPATPRGNLMRLRRGSTLVLDVMKLHQARSYRRVLEVDRRCLENIRMKLIPCLGLSADAVPEGPRIESAFFSVANFEYKLHPN